MSTGPVLEMDEIERQYDGEWVLLDEVECAEDGWVLRGRVRAHAPESDKLVGIPQRLGIRSGAVLYIGEPEWTGDIALAEGA